MTKVGFQNDRMLGLMDDGIGDWAIDFFHANDLAM